MHVSLHTAVAPAVESAKAAEPSNAAASFSQALTTASEAAQTQPAQDAGAGARDADKKPQKKTENAKDSSQTAASAQDAPVIQPIVPPAIAQQALPILQLPTQTTDQPVDGQTGDAGNTVASNSLTANISTSGVPTSVGLRPIRIADPIISSTSGGTDRGAAPSGGDDASAGPVENGSGATSGAILAAGDEALTPLPGAGPSLQGLTNISKGAPPKSSLLAQDAPVEKDQPILAQGDSAQAAAPAIIPPVVATPILSVPVSLPGGPDLTSMMTSAKPILASADGNENSTNPVSTVSKDRSTADVHGHHKTSETDADSVSGAAGVTVPVKFSAATAGSSGQGSSGQSDDKNLQPQPTAQVVLAAPTNNVQTAPHTASTPLPSDAPAIPVPTATAASADATATPVLSGARLIQSVHQSEMKLGMNSAEFGNISISTSVTHQALSAQISLDHSELGRVLAAHLPAMEEKLSSAYGLQARVEVNGGANSSYTGSSQHSSDGRQNQPGGSAGSSKFSSGLVPVIARSTSSPVLETSRLDIRI